MSDIVLKVAAKAVIVNDKGQVLVLREANTYKDGTKIGKYGLPGGRLNAGESYEAGLVREAKEETGLDVTLQKPLYVGEWRPVIRDVPHQIVAIFSLCEAAGSEVYLSEEHDDFQWIDESNFDTISFMEPDDKVVKLALAEA